MGQHVIVCIEQEPSLSAMQLIVEFRNTVHIQHTDAKVRIRPQHFGVQKAGIILVNSR
jgi:hypothetical protein